MWKNGKPIKKSKNKIKKKREREKKKSSSMVLKFSGMGKYKPKSDLYPGINPRIVLRYYMSRFPLAP